MPFLYLRTSSGSLRQGEILDNVVELRPSMARGQYVVGQTTVLERVDHPRAIVITQDCDLDWDYKAKQGLVPEDKRLAHVLFCDLCLREELRVRSHLASDLLRRVTQNQDERYHRLAETIIGETEWVLPGLGMNQEVLSALTVPVDEVVPELFADFKSVFSLPIEYVYSLIDGGIAVGKAVLPDPYLLDFVHRLHAFLGRIAIPE